MGDELVRPDKDLQVLTVNEVRTDTTLRSGQQVAVYGLLAGGIEPHLRHLPKSDDIQTPTLSLAISAEIVEAGIRIDGIGNVDGKRAVIQGVLVRRQLRGSASMRIRKRGEDIGMVMHSDEPDLAIHFVQISRVKQRPPRVPLRQDLAEWLANRSRRHSTD